MRTYSKLVVFAVITLLLITFTFSFVASAQNQNDDRQEGNGHGNPPGDVGENKRQYEKRNVEIRQHQKRAEIQSSWKGNNSEDSLNMNFDFEEGYPKININYEAEKKNKQVQLSFNLVFKKVFEFIDQNQNGRYDEKDEIVKSEDLNQVEFKNINYDNKKGGYNFNTESIDSSIRFRVQGEDEFAKYGSETLTPSEAKVNLELDYDFERDDSMLGLKITVESQHEKYLQQRTYDEEKGYAFDESGLKLKDNNYSGFFTWKNTAEVDGEDKPVNATFISESAVGTTGGEDVLYLCYQQGSEITHDPKVGVVGESALSYSSVKDEPILFFLMVLGVTISISAVVFYGGIYYRRKSP